MIQAIKAKIIVTPGHAPIKDSAVIVKNNIIEAVSYTHLTLPTNREV